VKAEPEEEVEADKPKPLELEPHDPKQEKTHEEEL
jgi:hypothetical protein